jgi:excisionase family DNA binding protein
MSRRSAGLGDDERLVVSPRRAWHMLGIGNTRGYQLLAKGELDSYRDGRARRITTDSIRRYIERRLAGTAAATTLPRSRGRPRTCAVPFDIERHLAVNVHGGKDGHAPDPGPVNTGEGAGRRRARRKRDPVRAGAGGDMS